MDSPYKKIKYRKKNNKPNTTISQPQSQTTNDTVKKKIKMLRVIKRTV